MKKFSIVLCLLCLSLGVPVLADPHGYVEYGGRVSYQQTGGYATGAGGEFTLFSYIATGSPGLLLSNSAYSTETRDVGGKTGSFQTFCMEEDEYINSPSAISDIWVSQSAVDEATGIAGLPGSGSHAYGGGTNTNMGDNLDPMTAYLYTQFAKGTLSNYDYLGSGRASDAGQLQKALWSLEDELTLGSSDTKAAAWVLEATTQVTTPGGSWYQQWGPTSIGDVRVLQLTNSDWTGHKQDQLFLTPVPGAVLLGILGLGAAGMKLRRFA